MEAETDACADAPRGATASSTQLKPTCIDGENNGVGNQGAGSESRTADHRRMKRSRPGTCTVQAPDGQHTDDNKSDDFDDHPKFARTAAQETDAQNFGFGDGRHDEKEQPGVITWWTCPWCDFYIIRPSAALNRDFKGDSARSRIRIKHVAEEHPDCDPNDPQAKYQEIEELKQRRLETIKQKRIENLKQQAKDHKGPHRLHYHTGYSLRCSKCEWTGLDRFLPNTCSKLRRGGFRLDGDCY